MSTLHQLLPHWMSSRRALHRDSGVPSSLMTRVEVCPPALWPSSLSFWGRARRWLDRSPWTPAAQRPVNRLALVKNEFRFSLDELRSPEASQLGERIERARSLRELWHLRSVLYGLLAVEFNQVEAERRMAQLNRHFPMRAPRISRFPLDA
ncbi:hypothetical protein [Aquabacterium sp.]|uniref:hypothetical protein n=1 Tax=Aquabacterium sp. TaxID=1872578 RepID=UPI002C04D544|nr:hypothetical protein [Aquabacterium sp.]HSW05848.1 hypothetical protein [Aquabacterium sp.]